MGLDKSNKGSWREHTNNHKEPQRKDNGSMNIEVERRHLKTGDGLPMSCRIPDILLEAFLVVMVATILPISLFLGVGLLLTWKQVHTSSTSRTRNHHKCSFKCFKLSATCTTCRLALLALLLLCGSSMTSAEKGKPQLQPSYEYEAAKMTKVTINLTEQQGIERKDSNKYKLHKMK